MFNEHVRNEIDALDRRGEESSNIMTHVMQAYLECADNDFWEYVKRLHDGYEDGDDLKLASLMTKAKVK
jgi:hypothetical protein